MKIHSFTTGTVRLSKSWREAQGAYPMRLMRTLTDTNLTEPLPIWCFLIEHPEGLILVDTGNTLDSNIPIWFPPHMPLVQRAAPFQINSRKQEIGEQLRDNGFAPEDVRWVILTHLHQDHEGGLHYFPNAEFIVSDAEWHVASGFAGRMAGYLNYRWFDGFNPTLITFDEPDEMFGARHTVTQAGDVYLVPTPGHTAGHLSVILNLGDVMIFFAGDASYTQDLLLVDALDGVSADAEAMHQTHRNILNFAKHFPTVYLPSHEWESQERLEKLQTLPLMTTEVTY